MSKLVVKTIKFYQKYLSFDRGALSFLAPGGACRYEISCSEYAKQSILGLGLSKGIWMGIKRIWSCR